MAEDKLDITIDAKLRLSMDKDHSAPNGAEDLIKQGANIHTVDPDTGETLLHIAASHGNTENIRWLIQEHNMLPNILDYDHNPPAYSAAAFGQLDAIYCLQHYGADLTTYGETIRDALYDYDAYLAQQFDEQQTSSPDLPQTNEIPLVLTIPHPSGVSITDPGHDGHDISEFFLDGSSGGDI